MHGPSIAPCSPPLAH
eukprot:CCRYP_015150-RH/>CCRYP_015150-RH protein AED:0.49 eAED:0.49 QI:0/-1/0/1/-1/0/1/0/15